MIAGLLFCLVAMVVAQLVTPYWWWIMLVPFFYGLVMERSGWRALAVGMISAGFLWLVASLYYWAFGGGIIAERITNMAGLSTPLLLVAASTVVALVVGGISAAAGYFLRAGFKQPSQS
jgi:hypothetical protein